MSSVGQLERQTQDRVILLLRDSLGCKFQGNWETHLCERHHNDRFTAILDRHLPTWRSGRSLLNSEPLAHAHWQY